MNVLTDQNWLLSLGTFLPIAGVALMLLVPKANEALIKQVGIATAAATVAIGIVTLLRFKVDRYGGGHPGLHHFGIQVDNLEEAEARIAPLGATELVEWNKTYGNREGTPQHWVGERKWHTPEGIAIDVNPSGWINQPGGKRGA